MCKIMYAEINAVVHCISLFNKVRKWRDNGLQNLSELIDYNAHLIWAHLCPSDTTIQSHKETDIPQHVLLEMFSLH